MFEMSAKANLDEGYAEFKLKSIFFQGEGQTEKAPWDGDSFMQWAHRMYAKLWMEDAIGLCKAPMVDIDWEKVKPGGKSS